MFQEYVEESSVAAQESLSIRDLMKVDPAELQTKIFCIREIRQEEPEQEDEDLVSRQFYRIRIEEIACE